MKEYFKSYWPLITLILGLMIAFGFVLIKDFKITNEVAQASIITLIISSLVALLTTILNNRSKSADMQANFEREYKVKNMELTSEFDKIQKEFDLKRNDLIFSKKENRKDLSIVELKEVYNDLKALYLNVNVVIAFEDNRSYHFEIKDRLKGFEKEFNRILTNYNMLSKKGDSYGTARMRTLTNQIVYYLRDRDLVKLEEMYEVEVKEVKDIIKKHVRKMEKEVLTIIREYNSLEE